MNKLSDRDKNLLLVLIILIIGVVYYLYIFTPQKEKIKTLIDERNEKAQQVEEYKTKIQNIESYRKKLEDEKNTIMPLAEKFYSDDIKQEDIIVFINDLVAKSNIELNQISFSEGDPQDIESLSGEANNEEADSGSEENVNLDSNVKLLNVDIDLGGTYSSIHEFIRLIENLDKNIIIDELNLRKDDSVIEEISYQEILARSENPNDVVSGSMKLTICNVPSLEEYKEERYVSILSDPEISLRKENSPFVSYPWGNWWTYEDNMSNHLNSSGYSTGTLVPSNTVIPQSIRNPIVRQVKPMNLTDFNDISKLKIISENKDNVVNLSMKNIPDVTYKVPTTTVQFAENSPFDDKVIVDLSSYNLKLDKRPRDIGLVMYANTANQMEVGLVIVDNNGVQHFVAMSKNINAAGKNEIETTLDVNMSYPIRISGIYIGRNEASTILNGEISLDVLYANYLLNK